MRVLVVLALSVVLAAVLVSGARRDESAPASSLLQTAELAMVWVAERDCPRLCSQSCECASAGISNCNNNCQQCLFDGVPCGTQMAPQVPLPRAAQPATAPAAAAIQSPRFQQVKSQIDAGVSDVARRMDAAIERAVASESSLGESSVFHESSGAPPSLEARVSMIEQTLLKLLARLGDPSVSQQISSAIRSSHLLSESGSASLASAISSSSSSSSGSGSGSSSSPSSSESSDSASSSSSSPSASSSSSRGSSSSSSSVSESSESESSSTSSSSSSSSSSVAAPANFNLNTAHEVLIRNLQELVAWVRRRKAQHGPDYGTDAHVNEVVEQALEIARSS